MRQILFAFGRLLLIGASALGLSTVANYYNHKGYWEGTIFRVQTTDFNLLSHALPTKLSSVLIKGDRAEIQRTLNSNYGLFGIVITNCTNIEPECSGQQIIYTTESNLLWKRQLSVPRLSGLPYNYLQDPPPLIVEGGYDTPRSTTWNASTVRNSGRIIGRVYYVRGVPPRFWSTYTAWFEQLPGSLLSDSGAQKYYTLTLGMFSLAGLSAWRLIEWIYTRKLRQKQLFDTEKKRIQEEKKQIQREVDVLQQELQEQLNQTTSLIVERQQFVIQLSQYQQAQEQQAQQLKQIVLQYETQLRKQQQNRKQLNIDHKEQLLEQAILRQEQAIVQLKKQITEQSKDSAKNTQALETLHHQLSERTTQQALAHTQLQQWKQENDRLLAQTKLQEHERQKMVQLMTQLQQQIQETEQRELEAKRQQREMEGSISVLQEQKVQLETEIQDIENPDLNQFEQDIITRLKAARKTQANNWLIIPKLDVKRGTGARHYTDCIVLGEACLVVIEAKHYSGTISANGDPKAATWHSKVSNGSSKQILCACYRNPYDQVSAYVDCVMSRLTREVEAKRIVIYGVVVFPDLADVSEISAEIGSYSRVTILEDLVGIIEELESAAIFRTKNKKPLRTPQQIEDLLYARPVRKHLLDDIPLQTNKSLAC